MLVATLAGLSVSIACSRDDATITTAHAQGESERAALRRPGDVVLPGIAAGSPAYVVEPVAAGGTVAGRVQLDGAPPADSAIVPPEEIQGQCGARFVDVTVSGTGGGLGGAVVWLEGVRRGKALPSVRRHEVTVKGCRLTPRVQAVVAGGTLHVHSEERLKTFLQVLRWPAGEVAATVAMNDHGEVVPDDRVLSAPAALELKGAQPAWLRAWVLAFDHPYATTTPDVGTFAIDSVPPGRYTLVAWHERFGRVTQPVTVVSGQATTATIRFGPVNGQATATDTARVP